MLIDKLFIIKGGSYFTTSLNSIKKNAQDNINEDFKKYLTGKLSHLEKEGINVEKLVNEKIKAISNPLTSEEPDLFIKSGTEDTKKEETKAKKIISTIKKFNQDGEKFILEATPEEMQILKKYLYSGDGNKVDKWLSSENKCTDGKDDGKIGIINIIGNIVEGAAKTFVGCAKDLFSDKKKLAGVIISGAIMAAFGLTAIGAAVLPFIGLATGGILIYKGTKKVITNAKEAANAKTDAEAKDKWENVGNGGLEVGVGIAASVGSVKEIRGVLSGGIKNIRPNAEAEAMRNREAMQTIEGIEKVANKIIDDPTNYIEE